MILTYLFYQLQNFPDLLAAFPFSLSHVLLIAGMICLLGYTAVICLQQTRAPLSVKALRDYLVVLQSKFAGKLSIEPEQEREKMEKLQNELKASCHQQTISANTELQELFSSIKKSMQGVTGDRFVANRSSWLKLNQLVLSFDEQYFPGRK